jgi:hypothetical protein
VRERSDKLVRELVLDDAAPFAPLVMKKRGKEIDYEAKTVMLAGRRYIVCRNRREAEKDAADRASIVATLERQLARGDKALIGNTGFRRYLKTISDEHFAIDADKIEEEKKFDGIFVLRTTVEDGFNDQGPDGLINISSPGLPPKLGANAPGVSGSDRGGRPDPGGPTVWCDGGRRGDRLRYGWSSGIDL